MEPERPSKKSKHSSFREIKKSLNQLKYRRASDISLESQSVISVQTPSAKSSLAGPGDGTGEGERRPSKQRNSTGGGSDQGAKTKSEDLDRKKSDDGRRRSKASIEKIHAPNLPRIRIDDNKLKKLLVIPQEKSYEELRKLSQEPAEDSSKDEFAFDFRPMPTVQFAPRAITTRFIVDGDRDSLTEVEEMKSKIKNLQSKASVKKKQITLKDYRSIRQSRMLNQKSCALLTSVSAKYPLEVTDDRDHGKASTFEEEAGEYDDPFKDDAESVETTRSSVQSEQPPPPPSTFVQHAELEPNVNAFRFIKNQILFSGFDYFLDEPTKDFVPDESDAEKSPRMPISMEDYDEPDEPVEEPTAVLDPLSQSNDTLVDESVDPKERSEESSRSRNPLSELAAGSSETKKMGAEEVAEHSDEMLEDDDEFSLLADITKKSQIGAPTQSELSSFSDEFSDELMETRRDTQKMEDDTESLISITEKIATLQDAAMKPNALREKYLGKKTVPGYPHCIDNSSGRLECLPPGELARKAIKTEDLWGIKEYEPLSKEKLIHLMRCIEQHPTNEHVCLMYVLPMNHPEFNPYYLQVVKPKDLNLKKYFTLSKYGVMIFSNGFTYFHSMLDFEREMHLFDKIKKIKFFVQYRMWKAFYIWRYNVRHSKLRSIKQNIDNYMFITKRPLRRMITELFKMCDKICSMGFLSLKPFYVYALKDFIMYQENRLKEIYIRLRAFETMVIEMTLTACRSALIEAGFSPDEYPQELDYYLKGLEIPVDSLVKPVGVLEYPGQWLNYSAQAKKRRICARLTNFIHLIDYYVQKTYHCLMKNSMFTLMCEMDSCIKFIDREYFIMPKHLVKFNHLMIRNEQQGGKILLSNSESPIFDLGCNWQEDKLAYSPSLDDFKSGIRFLFNMWQEAIFTYPNMLPNKVFDPYTQPIINGHMQEKNCGNGPSMQLLVETDVDLPDILDVIDLILTHGIEVCDSYTEIFEEIRLFCIENETINVDKYRDVDDVQEFGRLLEKYQKQMEIIDKIEDEHSMGVFRVNNSILRENAFPTVQRCLAVLHEVIPKAGGNFVTKLIDRMQAALAILEKDPTNADEYVDYLLFLDDIIEQMDDIEKDLDICSEIFDLMEQYLIPSDDEEMRGYNNLQPLLLQLRNIIDRQILNREKLIAELMEHFKTDTEKIFEDMEVIREKALAKAVLDPSTDAKEMSETMTELKDRLLAHQERANKFNMYQKQLKLDVTNFEPLEELIKDVKLRHQLWDSMYTWNELRQQWDDASFNSLDHEEMTKDVNRYLKSVSQLEKGLPPNDVVPILKEKVEDMKNQLPLIANLQNPNLKRRHWDILEKAMNRNLTDDSVTLKSLNESGVQNFAELIQEVSAQASSEFSLEALLKKVEDSWKDVDFVVLPHKDQRDVFILGGTDEIQVLLDDSNINMTTIASSRHVGPIKHKVDEWVRLLDLFARTLDEWLTCQRNWIYLESIFSAPDIQRQLPNEAKMFGQVDKSWRDIMSRTNKMPAALRSATQPGLLEALQTNNELLDQIMKCLDDYLESKRVVFPRFYFLSNEELLEILAQTRNPQAVQPHLRKCFDAIQKLEFGGPPSAVALDVLAMFSPEDERVQLTKGLKARGNVEEWLCKVEDAMFTSLKRVTRNALTDYHLFEREEWVQKFASQCVLTISQMMWCQQVHEILDGLGDRLEGMRNFELKNFDNLNKLAAMVRGQLTSLVRAVLCSLITIDVHARDIITSMVKNEVDHSGNFEWLKQLRYYWEPSEEIAVAKMANAKYNYGYEYLGASPRLVITPLTDRCYLCLMGALQLDLGGAPAGPAGTGKTETTKDLAKSLAFMCVVFNCSDGIDYKMMGRFFSGLAQSGGWCCFDEFNRIEIEVLSVIAQQLITIRLAKVQRLTRFMFEGREIKLIRTCAAFITMNPGYAGRTELPDNLKALFRPISMMVPDYTLIAEVILYSEGFESSKILANKMTQMYKLCSEQLSQQDHYDFGMRAVKSVLVMAGSLKRSNPDINENIVLIRALRDSNLPKFLAHDAILLHGIIQDLFPGVEIPETDYGVLQTEGIRMALEKGLQAPECFIRKMIQLFDTMVVRHGVMLVGPTGGGKTSIYNVLRAALTALGGNKQLDNPLYKNVETYILNPKAVSLGELYGEINPITLEWRDGLLGIMVRTAVKPKMTFHQWVICDGPVDAVWIENMNTVLDDNKMLCLANSERIKLTNWVHMMFEVADLAQASPATVSRCGMVYVDPKEMGWLPYVQSWMKTLVVGERDDLKGYLIKLFERHIDAGLEFIRKNCQEVIPQAVLGKVAMLCSILEAIIVKRGIDMKMENAKFFQLINQIFVFAYVWSIGGNIFDRDHQKFDTFVRDEFAGEAYMKLPKSGLLYGYYNNMDTKKMDMWEVILPAFVYNPNVSFVDVLVPTVDTVRFGFLMELLLSVNRAVLLTGSTGTGKSAIAKYVLTSISGQYSYLPVFINFSAQTTSKRTQEMIEGKLEKRKKTLMSAPYGKKVIVFIDDVNMPKLDKYGAQPAIELLRQLMDFNGCYDRAKMFWKELQNVIMSAACAPPGGGRNAITPRLLRHFCLMAIPSPSQAVLVQIYRAIMRGFLDDFQPEVKDLADKLVNAAISTYQFMSVTFLPTPSKSHYLFNMRDLSKCIQGVLQANKFAVMNKTHMTRLFYHECLRVFHDRLTDEPDRNLFMNTLTELCVKVLGVPLEKDKMKSIIYGDFMKGLVDKENRVYDEITNKDKLKQLLNDFLDEFNIMSGREMHLVFFGDAAEHITRIARILRTDRGNALLVGVGGAGKQSLTKLGAYISGYNCFQIELMRGYDYNSFHDDLKILYEKAGMRNDKMCFLFTDTQIAYEEFLEDINNILNSGEVPNLLEAEDQERMISAIRADARQEQGIEEDNRDALYDYFIRRIRSNLHIVLCMSPVGDSFRVRCRMFPSLVNCCTINWFCEWPTEALLSVARTFMAKIDLGKNVTPNSMADISVLVHESVTKMSEVFYEEMRRRYYTTPSSYLELIKLFTSMLQERRDKIFMGKARIQNGLTKLLETNVLVKEMRVKLKDLEPVLRQKSEAVENLMVKLAEDQGAADVVRKNVQVEETAAKAKAVETQAIAEDAQKDLAEALPALEAAVKALDALDKADIAELRVFQKPPEAVKMVMESVCILFNSKADWATAKTLLADSNFLKKLYDFPKDNVSDATIKKLKPYIDNPKFQPGPIEKISKACKSICLWVRAIDLYVKVFRTVEPKRNRYLSAQAELDQVMETLRTKQAQLNEVEKKIHALQEFYENTLAEKQQLEDNMELTAQRLKRAGRLTSALASEQTRWQESVLKFDEELKNLIGDVFVGSACVAYFGAFTSHYRQILTKGWVDRCVQLKLPVTRDFTLSSFADPFEVRVWNTSGLPKDATSTENAVLVTRGRRWPLMIDPQDQANRWIKRMEADKQLKVLKLSDGNFMRTMENCIRLGTPCLLEEVGETLDPSLEPILQRQVVTQGGRLIIRLGDSNVDYDQNFRLYMTTKLANPHYLPEICIKVTIINFTVTMSGLEDQLLSEVVGIERPDLETQRSTLIASINNDKNQLISLESKILRLLFQSEGNILDDEELVEALNDSKKTSVEIVKRLKEAEETEVRISAAREKYRPVASRGSVLYFVVAQLTELDPMYQYSLKYFVQVFIQCIASTEKTEELEERLRVLRKTTTLATYINISRGLFEKDKLVFSFMLCSDIMRNRDSITDAEWDFFLRGGVGVEQARTTKPGMAEWINTPQWNQLCDLESTFPIWDNITIQALKDAINITFGNFKFLLFAGSTKGGLRTGKTSANWDKKLSKFQKLLFIKCCAEEKLVEAVTEFVRSELGQKFVESPSIDLGKIYKDLNKVTPLVFVLSVGSDPMAAFYRFASELEFHDRISTVSLGQGQGPVAENMIRNATSSGDWVFLQVMICLKLTVCLKSPTCAIFAQNCHLAASWMPALEVVVKTLSDNADEVADSFRLYLSSMPSRAFPVSVLQDSVKITNEPPKGIRANVRQAMADLEKNFFEDNVLGSDWKRMLFGICFFHAVIQERKKFGPLGWNIKYEFNDSDRNCALLNLDMFCKEGRIPWDALEYITGQITYGGRITDGWDQRCLTTILKTYFCERTLAKNHKYSPSGIYYAPLYKHLKDYITYIDKLPIIDEPEIFGMHDNANITFQQQESANLLNCILSVQPRQSAGKAASAKDEIAFEQAVQFEKKLPPIVDVDSGSPTLFDKDREGRLPSLSVFLKQEVDRFNKMLSVMKSSLEQLKKGIQGLVVMSEDLERMYQSFLINQVPANWTRVSYGSLKSLASWYTDMLIRANFIERWFSGQPPVSYWLSGFFFQQGFLTAVLQTFARRHSLPIDQLRFLFSVAPIVKEEQIKLDLVVEKSLVRPMDGVLVHGLYLEAARWDFQRMTLADPKPGEMNPMMPVIHFKPAQNPDPPTNVYTAPLYKTSVRAGILSTTGHSTNFIVPIHLPSKQSEDYWILKGTALLSQLTD